jgi:hypothetical protein
VAHEHLERCEVDLGYAAEKDANIWLIPKEAANGTGDVGR